jgi:hypothetical protein
MRIGNFMPDKPDNPEPNPNTATTPGNPEAVAAETFPEAPQDEAILQNVLLCLDTIPLEFDFKVLDVLEDEKATPPKVEVLKEQLGTMVSMRLFSIANSVHYGKQRSGQITKFIDVVKHLGTETTKTTAIFVALLSLANTEELRTIFARNFATSKLAEMFAAQLGLKGNERSTVTLGGLFVEMGKVIMLLYAGKESFQYPEGFVEKYHPYIGTKVIEKFELPASLIAIVDHPCLTFIKKDSLDLSAVVDMAHAIVNDSFTKYGKLRIQSPMPDPEGLLYTSTIGSLIKEQFNIMGIGSYIEVLEAEYTDLEQRIIDRGQ